MIECAQRRESYAAPDVTYGTNNEFGFELPAR
jgi:preprotein translocase subunit SecA